MTYIALTIGPIYKTLQNAKKTRELWGGSYLFSYMMKKLIAPFSSRTFIVPYIGDPSVFEEGNEVGLFHDRFIFQSEEGDYATLLTNVDTILADVAKEMGAPVEFVRGYFQITPIEVDLPDGSNPILEISPILDSKELFVKVAQFEKNHLQHFLKNRISKSFLTNDAFKKRVSFPSLAEISTTELDLPKSLFDREEEEETLFEMIEKQTGVAVKPYHKYIAIVHADGDNLGRSIEKLKSTADFNAFSKKLFEFASQSHTLIKEYGGQTVFAGGDDLLFFAPVLNQDQALFDLLESISALYDTKFDGLSTLSFGVSVTYHKFPLYEALELSRELLYKAKSGTKNQIAYRVIKHSGQYFEGMVSKSDKRHYQAFLDLIRSVRSDENTDPFLHSIYTKIDTNKTVIEEIKADRPKIRNFFSNYYNETEHDQYRGFFETLTSFLHLTQNVPLLYSTLRFIKFAKGDKQ